MSNSRAEGFVRSLLADFQTGLLQISRPWASNAKPSWQEGKWNGTSSAIQHICRAQNNLRAKYSIKNIP